MILTKNLNKTVILAFSVSEGVLIDAAPGTPLVDVIQSWLDGAAHNLKELNAKASWEGHKLLTDEEKAMIPQSVKDKLLIS